MRAYLYDSVRPSQELNLTREAVASVGADQLLWIDIRRSDEDALDFVSKTLSISAEALEAVRFGGQVRQLDSFHTHFQFSLPLAPGATAQTARIDFLVNDRWLLTVYDGNEPYFDAFRANDRDDDHRGRLTPTVLTASLLDWHLENYRSDIFMVEKLIDRIDETILAAKDERPPLASLAKLRSRVGLLRSRLDEHRPILRGMLRSDFAQIAGLPHSQHFDAIHRHFERTEDMVNRAQGIIIGSFELYATRTAQDTNELVKRLTVVTISMGLAEMIPTLFSMNFDIPFTNTGWHGFSIVVVAMAIIAAGSWLFAMWRKWV
jgi:magnesium transporter